MTSMGFLSSKRFCMLALVAFGLVFAVTPFQDGDGSGSGNKHGVISTGVGSSGGEGGNGTVTRIGETCSKESISINQGQTPPLPSGIPTYTVNIENVCVTGCSISNIHFRCGAFASARLINPKIFRRLTVGDCLVNNGDPMVAGSMISFQYANTFSYPLEISQLTCL